jgi:hypothetical protein
MSVTTTKKPAAKATFSMLGGSLTQPRRPAPKPLAAGKPVAPPPAPPPPPEAVAPPAPPRVVAPDLDDARIAARVRNLALVQEKLPDVFNRGALRRLPADVGERLAALGPSQQEAYDVLKWWRGMPAYRAEVQRRRAAEEYRRGRLDDDDRVARRGGDMRVLARRKLSGFSGRWRRGRGCRRRRGCLGRLAAVKPCSQARGDRNATR